MHNRGEPVYLENIMLVAGPQLRLRRSMYRAKFNEARHTKGRSVYNQRQSLGRDTSELEGMLLTHLAPATWIKRGRVSSPVRRQAQYHRGLCRARLDTVCSRNAEDGGVQSSNLMSPISYASSISNEGCLPCLIRREGLIRVGEGMGNCVYRKGERYHANLRAPSYSRPLYPTNII